MSFLEYHMIQEARKNPELNSKVPAIKVIQQCAEEADNPWEQYTGDVSNCFVSFTKLDKLGINPKSQYDTPNGVYAYDGKSFEDKYVSNDVPFAGTSPYINVFKSKKPSKIVILNMMSNKQFQDLVDRTREYYISSFINRGLKRVGKTELSQADHDYIWKGEADRFERWLNDSQTRSYNTSYGGRWWYMTMACAQALANKVNYDQPRDENNLGATQGTPNSWNKLFRGIGVDGVVDTGEGIIHSAEKRQSYFVGADVVEVITRITNKEYQRVPLNNSDKITIGNYITDAIKKKDPKKVASIINKAFIQDAFAGGKSSTEQYGVVSSLNDIYKRMLNRLCSTFGDAPEKGKKYAAHQLIEYVDTLYESIDYLDMGKNDHKESIYAWFNKDAANKRNNIMEGWPLLTYPLAQGKREEVRDVLNRMHYFANDSTSNGKNYLVEVIGFFAERNQPWWEDDFFEWVINNWDKQYPSTDTQVGVWNSAESWGYVK